ncbi:transcription factor HES-2-like [Anoplopoma fimbria]|uniref:transcription factor HES-2-like n=1 Tax=Anoplopoma fimbria TaxID=229290 RepID=UPI0023EC74AC|nr:transcription factor HES-2-like [Anoplopoma fimbria]
MKLHQDSEATKEERKSLKPQVERRRRERMNRSLESLKTLLLQQQETCQRRVEKAEILEHTVLFLQNTVERNTMRAEGGGGGGGGQKHSFQDGFSTCLQTAAQFLGPDGKGLRLGEALSSSSLPLTQTILRMLRQKTKHRLHVRDCSIAHPYRLPVQQESPRNPQRQNPASKQSLTQSSPVSQAFWRPWP